MMLENQDVVDVKFVHNSIRLWMKAAWKEYYEWFSNVEFDWNVDHLSEKPFVKGLNLWSYWSGLLRPNEKNGKTATPFQIVPEMLMVSSEAGVILIDWENSF